MAFTSIVIVIVVIYVFGYAGMIIYDLFLRKDPVEFMPKPKDVEIDISDEAGQFKPITVELDKQKIQPAVLEKSVAHADEEATDRKGVPDIGQNNQAVNAAVSSPSSQPKSKEEQNAKQPEHGSTDDIEPRVTDVETKKRINELVRIRRQEILSEHVSAATDAKEKDNPKADAGNNSAKENDKGVKEKVEKESSGLSTDPKVRIVEPGQSSSPDVADTIGQMSSTTSTPSRPPKVNKSPKPFKPPKQPEHHNDAHFDLKVAIDRAKQHTKLQGARTAEQVSEEAKCAFIDETLMVLKQIDSDWEIIEQSRVIDEDDQQAIDKAAMESREAPPQFNI